MLAPLVAGVVVASAPGCGPAGSGAAAEALWAEHCASCHGEDGRGVRARRTLEPQIDLRRSQAIARGDRQQLIERIANGYAAMPGFAHKLSHGDIERLAEFAVRLARKETP